MTDDLGTGWRADIANALRYVRDPGYEHEHRIKAALLLADEVERQGKIINDFKRNRCPPHRWDEKRRVCWDCPATKADIVGEGQSAAPLTELQIDELITEAKIPCNERMGEKWSDFFVGRLATALEQQRKELTWVRDVLAEHIGYVGPLAEACCPLRAWLLPKKPTKAQEAAMLLPKEYWEVGGKRSYIGLLSSDPPMPDAMIFQQELIRALKLPPEQHVTRVVMTMEFLQPPRFDVTSTVYDQWGSRTVQQRIYLK